jgi:hypothetical protein
MTLIELLTTVAVFLAPAGIEPGNPVKGLPFQQLCISQTMMMGTDLSITKRA